MEKANYKNVAENPCHMCMPMGGVLAFKGIENSMVLVHGSQGCSTYMRLHTAGHFNEPVDIASSSLNEKGTVYGGETALQKGLDNVIMVYQPQLIGVLTTCLAETIGEDIERFIARYLQEKGLSELAIIPVPTPGYGGSHSEGYWMTVKTIVTSFVQKNKKHKAMNIIVPNLSPADIREIKRLIEIMGIEYTLLPDISDTLDQPYNKVYTKIPVGGTKIEQIKKMSGAVATIQLAITVEKELSPGKYLEEEFEVPLYNLPLPMGIKNTDLFLQTLQEISGNQVPNSLLQERGRLQDCMVDSHKYNMEGQSAIFGEPELVYALVNTCLENGVHPAIVATGSGSKKIEQLLQPQLAQLDRPSRILTEGDFMEIARECGAKEVNLAIGHSGGKFLTEKYEIPLVRVGFPIHDRIGGSRILSLGYNGTINFLDRLTNTLLERKLSTYRQACYDKYYQVKC
ncbi:MAG: Nitrogenase molybdenum-iron protein beta chain [candidate division WS2 bacterium]|nr:Nitrogenase molybdenum-iron protein beta chain [Candidatus Psychracetigena formicireducens]